MFRFSMRQFEPFYAHHQLSRKSRVRSYEAILRETNIFAYMFEKNIITSYIVVPLKSCLLLSYIILYLSFFWLLK